MTLLALENLSVRFGAALVVDDVSFTIAPGEKFALVGESGSGKTVSALSVLRLNQDADYGGRILLDGDDLLQKNDQAMRGVRGKDIAMIFQEPMTALNPVMQIGKQVAECATAHSGAWTGREAKRRAVAALEAVAIPEASRRYSDYPHQFSGGQRQRIMIAMALINRPRLLIADEPTTALDVTVQAQVLMLLKELQQEHGLAMLFISHDLAVVSQMATRVAVMRGGLVVETGDCAQLLTRPEHAYTRSLLAAAPTLHTNRDQPLVTLESISMKTELYSPHAE